jgi:hypothetical protein
MQRRRGIFVFLCACILLTACPHQPWPVPVPEKADVAGQLKRLELDLPITHPATCRNLDRQAFLRQPDRCPPLEKLKGFLERHTARFTPVPGPSFHVDENLWALMQVLTSAEMLRTDAFPKHASVLPEHIRQLRTWTAIDARDRTPPQGRPTVAFLYRNFWWTFWQKHAAPPPPPDAETDFMAKSPFDRLIVFPEFPGRMSKGG